MPTSSEPMKLGELNRIPLQLKGPSLQSVVVRFDYTEFPSNQDNTSSTIAKFDSLGKAYIEVSPKELGRAAIYIAAWLSDRGLETESIDTTVVLSSDDPERYFVEAWRATGRDSTGIVLLDRAGKDSTSQLFPRAIYKGSDIEVSIPPEFIQFEVLSATPD